MKDLGIECKAGQFNGWSHIRRSALLNKTLLPMIYACLSKIIMRTPAIAQRSSNCQQQLHSRLMPTLVYVESELAVWHRPNGPKRGTAAPSIKFTAVLSCKQLLIFRSQTRGHGREVSCMTGFCKLASASVMLLESSNIQVSVETSISHDKISQYSLFNSHLAWSCLTR